MAKPEEQVKVQAEADRKRELSRREAHKANAAKQQSIIVHAPASK